LLSGNGFIDNIRNDEILPSIGHPFLLAVLELLKIDSRYFIYVSIVLCIILVFSLLLKFTNSIPLSAIGSTLYLYFCPSVFLQDGVEISLLLFGTVWIVMVICTVYYRTLSWFISIGIYTVITILIRPLLLPLIALSFFLFIILFALKSTRVRINKDFIKNIFLFFGIVILSLGFVSMLSFVKYGDNRFVSGTYGSIGLYCAFNPYINLQEKYVSCAWNKVPDELRDEALDPLILKTTWQERDRLLKRKALSFILHNPSQAVKAYFWRAGKYSWSSDRTKQRILFYLAFASIAITGVLNKRCMKYPNHFFIVFLSFYLIVIYIGIKSLFLYAGERHLTDTIPILFQPILLLLTLVSNIKSFRIMSDLNEN